MSNIGAVQVSDLTLRGGDVISHIAAALAGRPEGYSPSSAIRVVPGIDKPIPVHEHEQGSADMQHVRGSKEVSPADFPPLPQVLGLHCQGGRLGGFLAHLQPDPGYLGVRRYPADKAQV